MATKYNMRIIPKKGTAYNPVHEDADNTTAVIIDLTIGERGWIAYMPSDTVDYWSRLHLSTIEKINVGENGEIEVVTRNTHYFFTPLS